MSYSALLRIHSALTYAVPFSFSVFRSVSSYVYIPKSTPRSYLRSAPLIRLDFIYVMFLSSVTP